MRVLIAFGTRPEAIKLAPLIKGLDDVMVLNTGQHTDLLQPILELFKIEPHYNLNCQNPDLLTNFSCISLRVREVLKEEKPHAVLVQGDTLTTFAVSFAAFLEKIPIIHLEAGLRSWNKFSPFPEEVFRLLADDIADVYLAPTHIAYDNLIKEGKREDRIFVVGNSVIDAIYLALEYMDEGKEYQALADLLNMDKDTLKDKEKVFITSHRRESFGEPLRRICRGVKSLAEEYSHILFIWSLHKNPEVRKVVLEEFQEVPANLKIIEPLSYTHTLILMKYSEVILTDSGGIQEEAPTFGKPILVLRDVTERVEAHEAGFSFLVGREEGRIIEGFKKVYKNEKLRKELSLKPNPYGDGKTTARIKALLKCEDFKDVVLKYTRRHEKNLHFCKSLIDEFRPSLFSFG